MRSRCALALTTIHGAVDTLHLSMLAAPYSTCGQACCIGLQARSFKPWRRFAALRSRVVLSGADRGAMVQELAHLIAEVVWFQGETARLHATHADRHVRSILRGVVSLLGYPNLLGNPSIRLFYAAHKRLAR